MEWKEFFDTSLVSTVFGGLSGLLVSLFRDKRREKKQGQYLNDSSLFKEINENIKKEDILDISNFDFGGSVIDRCRINKIDDFVRYFEISNKFFLNKKLEKLRKNLFEDSNKFTSLFNKYYWTKDADLYQLDNKYESLSKTDIRLFHKELDTLNYSAKKIKQTYDEFIRVATKSIQNIA